MSKRNQNLGAMLKAFPLLLLCTAVWLLSACDDDGLTAGDPNYFTSSRGQFTATLDDNTTLFLLPGTTSGTAFVTYDGDNPRHWASESSASVNVTTYSGDFVLPEMVTANGKTYTITGIGEQAFMGCRGLTTIALPSTISTLEEGAFAICTSLKSIDIPEGVATIPTGCFGYCPKLTAVTLPSTVTKLDKMAFYGCSVLATITLPANLQQIGEMAFFDCPKLTEITIPATVTKIGNRAFGGRSATSKSAIAAYHMLSANPPTLEGILYEAQDGVNPVIYVPAGAKSTYLSAAGWSELTIEEE